MGKNWSKMVGGAAEPDSHMKSHTARKSCNNHKKKTHVIQARSNSLSPALGVVFIISLILAWFSPGGGGRFERCNTRHAHIGPSIKILHNQHNAV
jgi:hypothetical protein